MQWNPYLHFNGQCEEAFELYQRCLGGKIEAMIKFAGTPGEQHVPPAQRDKIMHARLVAGDNVLMGSDGGGPESYELPKGFSVSISVGDPAEAERIFNTLAENGKIGMPIQQTFWAVRFGTLRDRFGIPWMVNCEGGTSEGMPA